MAGISGVEATGVENAVWTDQLIHTKVGGEEIIAFPYTRYQNILGSPKVETSLEAAYAPFFFFQTDEVELDEVDVDAMVGVTINASV